MQHPRPPSSISPGSSDSGVPRASSTSPFQYDFCRPDVEQQLRANAETVPQRGGFNDVLVPVDNTNFQRFWNQNGHPREKRAPKPESYKTVICQAWLESRRCSFAENCRFAHGEAELRPSVVKPKQTEKYKTKLCDKFTTQGICPFGSRCLFIHPNEGSNDYIRQDKLAEVTKNHEMAEKDCIEKIMAQLANANPLQFFQEPIRSMNQPMGPTPVRGRHGSSNKAGAAPAPPTSTSHFEPSLSQMWTPLLSRAQSPMPNFNMGVIDDSPLSMYSVTDTMSTPGSGVYQSNSISPNFAQLYKKRHSTVDEDSSLFPLFKNVESDLERLCGE